MTMAKNIHKQPQEDPSVSRGEYTSVSCTLFIPHGIDCPCERQSLSYLPARH